MTTYQGFILFLLGILTGLSIFGMAGFFYPHDTSKKMLRCEANGRETKIGLMIDEGNRTLTLEGREVPKENVKTFSDYLIYAKWNHSHGTTEINLDRLSGVLEVTDIPNPSSKKEYQKFDCAHISQKF